MNRPPATIMLAGVPVRRELVAWVAERVDEPASARLQRALAGQARLVALDVAEREQILRTLDDPPDGLTELRAVLLQEHVGRKRDELA